MISLKTLRAYCGYDRIGSGDAIMKHGPVVATGAVSKLVTSYPDLPFDAINGQSILHLRAKEYELTQPPFPYSTELVTNLVDGDHLFRAPYSAFQNNRYFALQTGPMEPSTPDPDGGDPICPNTEIDFGDPQSSPYLNPVYEDGEVGLAFHFGFRFSLEVADEALTWFRNDSGRWPSPQVEFPFRVPLGECRLHMNIDHTSMAPDDRAPFHKSLQIDAHVHGLPVVIYYIPCLIADDRLIPTCSRSDESSIVTMSSPDPYHTTFRVNWLHPANDPYRHEYLRFFPEH
jgi:hypothetical protein